MHLKLSFMILKNQHHGVWWNKIKLNWKNLHFTPSAELYRVVSETMYKDGWMAQDIDVATNIPFQKNA